MTYTKLHIDDFSIIRLFKLSSKARALLMLFFTLLAPCFLFAQTCPDNNHPHMIDLGLPSGTKWACCNVGADDPSVYGGCYAWGETKGKLRYDWDSYQYGNFSYSCQSLGDDIAGTNYDVAHVLWGGRWVIPSLEQIKELLDNCSSTECLINNVRGQKFTGPSGNSVFLPYAGYCSSYDPYNNVSASGSAGFYWSSNPSSIGKAYMLQIGSSLKWDSKDRYLGYSVRPVCEPEIITFSDQEVKRICVENWDTNNDGDLSVTEAAAVTSLDNKFESSEISSFDELQYFTGLTSIENGAFICCESLASIIIPNNVTSIGDEALKGCISLTSVTIPNSVVSIGEHAFFDCPSLTSVTIPESVTRIGNCAFGWSAITSINIPASVTNLGTEYFYGCDNLTTITVSSGNPVFDSRDNCNAIIETSSNKLIAGCKNTVIPNSVSAIEQGAFSFCTFTSINIPSSVTSIGDEAFSSCISLTSVTVEWKEPLVVPKYTFAESSADQAILYVPIGTVTAYKNADVWKDFGFIVEIGSPDPHTIIDFADQEVKRICVRNWDTDNDGELSMNEASAVTKISSEFYDNRNITSFDELKYFANMTEIGEDAFRNCQALTSITFPKSLTTIGNWAFYNCYALKAIVVPASVSSIGYAVFSCCSDLNKIEVDPANSYYDSRGNCNAIIEKNTMTLLSGCNSSTIPDGVTAIETEAFRGMYDLKNIQMPNSLKTIANHAFYYCTGLTGQLNIPEGVSSIGRYAFYKCTGLTSIELPSTLEGITYRMLYSCDNVSTMKVNWETPPSVSSDFFTNYSNCVLKVPDGCVETYKSADVWKTFKDIIDNRPISFADNNVKTICVRHWDTNGDGEISREEAAAVTKINQEFYENGNITSFDELKYFANVTEIAENAFYNCQVLTSITFPQSLTTIGGKAFFNCFALKEVYIPASVSSIGSAVFSCCTVLNKIEVDQANSYYDSRGNCNAIIEKSTMTLLAGCNNTIIPEGVAAIETEAFRGMYDLKNIQLPNSLKTIANHAFYYCTGLTGQLNIPEGVTSIGRYAFYKCTGLTFIELPSTLEEITYRMFYSCDNVTTMKVNWETPPSVSSDFFTNYSNCVLAVPEGSVAAYKSANIWKDFKEVRSNVSYTLSIQSSAGGTVSYNSSEVKEDTQSFSVDEGATVVLNVIPDAGFELTKLTINGADVTSSVIDDKYIISNITTNNTVVAQFSKKTYTLTIQSTGNGKVTYNGNDINNATQSFLVEHGSMVSFSLSPNDGHQLFSLSVNGKDVSSEINDCKYTVNDVTSNVSVVAVFDPIPVTTFLLSIQSSAGGMVSYNGINVGDGEQTFNVSEGTNVSLSITPAMGFELTSLQVNGNEVKTAIIDGKYTISELSENTTVKATFSKRIFTLSIEAVGNGTVAFKTDIISNTIQNFTVEYGTTATVTITPGNGYQMASIILNGTNVTANIINGTFTIPEISGNNTLRVTFETIPVTTFSLTIQSSIGGGVSYNGANVYATTRIFSVNEGASVTFGITPDMGYELERLSVNGSDVTQGVIGNNYIVDNISQNTTVEAQFKKKTFSLYVSSVGNGMVVYGSSVISNEAMSFSVEYNASVPLVIIPSDGQMLASFIVNGEDVTAAVTNNIYTIANITSTQTVNVVFEQIPAKTYTLNLEVSGGGTVTYSGVAISHASRNFTVNEGSSTTLIIQNNVGYRLKSLLVNNNDMTSSVIDNKYFINNIIEDITVKVEFEAIPIQRYNIEVSVSTGGQVEVNGAIVSNESRIFTVDEGTSVTLYVLANTQYKLGKLAVDGIDMISSVHNNNLTINNISSNKKVNVIFELITDKFTIDNINYGIISTEIPKVEVLVGDYSGHLSIPATVRYNGITWNITQIADNAFSGNGQLITVTIPPTVEICGNNVFGGCKRLSAIIWQPQHPLTNNQTGYIENKNLLFYSDSRELVPDGIENVVVNNHASQIKLIENNEFYCPITFITDKIYLTHHYIMDTGIGESKGWETLVLPFDVKNIIHVTKGEIVPFATYSAGNGTHPFWLYGYDSISGFVEATSIEANRPYVISMPNNRRYADEYILAGYVTFTSENVYVRSSRNLQPVICGDNMLWPSYSTTTKEVKALNVNNDYVSYLGGLNPGSTFIYNIREARPFEAYMTSVSGSNVSVSIFDDVPTGIGVLPEKDQLNEQIKVYSTSGQLMKLSNSQTPTEEILRGLPPGIYVVNGHKLVVK